MEQAQGFFADATASHVACTIMIRLVLVGGGAALEAEGGCGLAWRADVAHGCGTGSSYQHVGSNYRSQGRTNCIRALRGMMRNQQTRLSADMDKSECRFLGKPKNGGPDSWDGGGSGAYPRRQ